MTVNELATCSGTTPHAVRYYSRMGLLKFERHPQNGYRLYPQSETSWLRFIRQAKKLGFTLAEIKEIKHDADDQQSPCPRVREILQRRIVENRKQLDELEQLQTRMETALKLWEDMPDGLPDGHTVCHLIESYSDEGSSCH
ncbi:MAG: MerR family transcriptional regulator [Gammaproteobacteria bacterium]|nr:MAG: MerR family transcriptional regulator [Gammaproteobacteria bacterium]